MVKRGNKRSSKVNTSSNYKKTKSKNKWVIPLVIIFVFAILVIPFCTVDSTESNDGTVAIIPVTGTILVGNSGGYFDSSAASSEQIVNFIEKAENNDNVKAIIFEINSPGGSAVASDEIAFAIKSTTKPTVAVIREMGASGGYWIASATDHVIANRMSITGSIGVISSYLEFSGLMDQYGVSYERLVAGERKDLGVPFKELTDVEKSIFQKKLNTIHDYFIDAVSENRNLNRQEVVALATGEFYLGVEALNLGLVDELGNLASAQNYVFETLESENLEFVYYKPEIGLLDLLSGVVSDFSFRIGEGIGSMFTRSNQFALSV